MHIFCKKTGNILASVTGKTLIRADLRETKLREADLRETNLREADLRRAVLRNADLREANLREANLREAVLREADLRGAILRKADLRGAFLREADLRGAYLRGAMLSGARLVGAKLPPAPIISDIHKAVYEAANRPGALNMVTWHSCETTHCRAGWVVSLAGAPGFELEEKLGTGVTAALIYMASDPTLEAVPNWAASKESALEDMQRLAGR